MAIGRFLFRLLILSVVSLILLVAIAWALARSGSIFRSQ
jgi:hypothetical protein